MAQKQEVIEIDDSEASIAPKMDDDNQKPKAKKKRSASRSKKREVAGNAAVETIDLSNDSVVVAPAPTAVAAVAAGRANQSTTARTELLALLERQMQARGANRTSTARRAAGSATNEGSTRESTGEVRAARYRSHCPRDLRVRLERASTQRLYLIQQSDIPAPDDITNDSSVDFTVLGSTGNVYTVSLKLQPSCTCPDFCRRRDMCKHIMFVLLKVVGLNVDNELSYQEAYVLSELKALFGMLRVRRVGGSSRVMANAQVRAAVATTNGGGDATAASADATGTEAEKPKGVERKVLQEGDADCPICFEDLSKEAENMLTYCRSTCGANFHKACITAWVGASSNSANKSCPNCRQDWWTEDGGNANANRRRKRGSNTTTGNEGYMNVGALQGLSSHRDTSTYSRSYSRYRGYYDDDDYGGYAGYGGYGGFGGFGLFDDDEDY